jgi:hypothetical protein
MNEFGFNQMAWLFGGQEVDLSSAERAIDQLSQDRDAAQVVGARLGINVYLKLSRAHWCALFPLSCPPYPMHGSRSLTDPT